MKKISLLLSIVFLTFPLTSYAYPSYESCSTTYGFAAMDGYNGTCSCMSGYMFGTDIMGKKQCISMDSYCTDKYGYHATYDSLKDSCKCRYGYVMGKNFSGIQCVDGNQACHDKHGYNSSYSSLDSTCECDSGYTLDNSNQCVRKQNNVYFYVKELDTSERKAIIKSNYDYKYYSITYNSGCYSFSRYLNKTIVVNLGTDFDLDRWDKIVLQDDNDTCDITDREKVDSDFTLVEKQDSYTPSYSNYNYKPTPTQTNNFTSCPVNSTASNGSCYCNTGYQIDSTKTKCEVSSSSYIPTKVTGANCPENSSIKDGYCQCNSGYLYSGSSCILDTTKIQVTDVKYAPTTMHEANEQINAPTANVDIGKIVTYSNPISTTLTIPGKLRKCPSTSCDVIRFYAETATVKLTASSGEWKQVEAKNDAGENITGWIHDSVLDLSVLDKTSTLNEATTTSIIAESTTSSSTTNQTSISFFSKAFMFIKSFFR